MNKSYTLLRMYDKLRTGKKIKINDCCGEFGISVSTFRRYVAFLRAYFNEYYAQEVVYLPQTEEYAIKQNPPQ